MHCKKLMIWWLLILISTIFLRSMYGFVVTNLIPYTDINYAVIQSAFYALAKVLILSGVIDHLQPLRSLSKYIVIHQSNIFRLFLYVIVQSCTCCIFLNIPMFVIGPEALMLKIQYLIYMLILVVSSGVLMVTFTTIGYLPYVLICLVFGSHLIGLIDTNLFVQSFIYNQQVHLSVFLIVIGVTLAAMMGCYVLLKKKIVREYL